MAERLTLAGWARRDLCKKQAGVLLGSPENILTGRHGSGSRHRPECLWAGKQASEGCESGLIDPRTHLTQVCRAGKGRTRTVHVTPVSGYCCDNGSV